jgi:hypothetical protein
MAVVKSISAPFMMILRYNILSFNGRPADRDLLPEEVFQSFFGCRSGFLCRSIPQDVGEGKKVAEIASILVQNPFRLGLPALIIGSRIVKSTVEATVKIGAAGGAGFPPAGFPIDKNFTATMIASPHGAIFPLT